MKIRTGLLSLLVSGLTVGCVGPKAVHNIEDGPYVREWVLLGPFPTKALDKPAASGATRSGFDTDFLEPLGGEVKAVLTPATRVGTVAATTGTANVAFKNRHLHHGAFDQAVGYGYCTVRSPAATMRFAEFHSNGSPKIWLNGKLMPTEWHDKHEALKHPYRFPVMLQAGENRVLVKVDNTRRWWGFDLALYENEAAQQKDLLEMEREGAYKKRTRQCLKPLEAGDLEAAEAACGEMLEIFPEDPDFLFCKALVLSARKQDDAAADLARKAVDAGLPVGRFLAGPREWTAGLTESDAFKKQVPEAAKVGLVHGPLVGNVTDDSVSFWVRTAREVPVTVELSNGTQAKTGTATTSKDVDYTAVVTIGGLTPDTAYRYSVTIGETAVIKEPGFTVRTFPKPRTASRFSVVFGGGAGYTPKHERLWTTILEHRPAALLQLGDNLYIDDPESPAMQRYCYYRRQSQPEYRRLVSQIPVFAIWDDHDFGENDCVTGSEIETPPWKRQVWNVFRQNWVNPAYGGGDRLPGCWYRFMIGDVEFFMLDCRYYRSDPKDVQPSMLGRLQKTWLKKSLLESKAVFKVVVSSVPWAEGAKPHSLDAWDGYPDEREELFSFIERYEITGILLLSADRHRSDAWRIGRKNGYDLYDLESSKLINVHTHPNMSRALFSYNATCSFGKLTFDTARRNPRVVYEIYCIDNQCRGRLELKASQLKF